MSDMADKSWKAFERRIAKRVGGKRIPVTGERDGADVVAPAFVYQCKLRRGLPTYLKGWLRGIVAAGARKDSTGVVIWKTPGARDDDAVVVLRLRDWQDWHGVEDTGSESEKPAGNESDGPQFCSRGRSENEDNHLEHITASRPLATGYLVSSKPTEIHDGNRRDPPKEI